MRKSFSGTTAFALCVATLALTRLGIAYRSRTAARTTRAISKQNTAPAIAPQGEPDDMKPSVTTEKPVEVNDCGNCGAEAWGYTDAELAKEGWENHKGFRLCPECSMTFAERRARAAS